MLFFEEELKKNQKNLLNANTGRFLDICEFSSCSHDEGVLNMLNNEYMQNHDYNKPTRAI